MTAGAKPDTWMPLFIGDYLKDTGRLSTEQHGAYLLLIMDYWTNGPPADDDDELAAITRLDLKTWRKHRAKVERFFHVDGLVWRHKRIDAELQAAQGNSDKAADKARRAAEARWGKHREQSAGQSSENAASNAQAHAPSMLEECPSPSPSPIEEEPNGSVGSTPPADQVRKADLDAMWAMAPNRSRERSSRKDLERAVRAAVRRGRAVEQITAGLQGYFASREATKDGGEFAKGIHRMVEADRWAEFAPAGSLGLGGGGEASGGMFGPSIRDPSPARQRMWMDDWRANPSAWLERERGPKPGQPGCQVAAEIQREFGVTPAGEGA